MQPLSLRLMVAVLVNWIAIACGPAATVATGAADDVAADAAVETGAPDVVPDAALDAGGEVSVADVAPDVAQTPDVSKAPPSCVDAITNGQETDVDCGGLCAPCSDTKICAIAGGWHPCGVSPPPDLRAEYWRSQFANRMSAAASVGRTSSE